MITLHEGNASDFTNNGFGILEPQECTVEEQANGTYTLSMVHPIDSAERWKNLKIGRIIRANVPVPDSPDAQTNAEITREVWAVSQSYKSIPMYSLSENGKKLKTLKKGERLIKIRNENDRTYIYTVEGSRSGWVESSKITFTGEYVTQPSLYRWANPVGTTVEQNEYQLFRIQDVEINTDDMTVSVTAPHVFYDGLNDVDFYYTGDEDKTYSVDLYLYAVEREISQANYSVPLRDLNIHVSSIINNITVSQKPYGRSIVDILLNEDDGICRQCNGKLIRDNFNAWIMPNNGRDLGYTVRYAKNLQGVTMQTDVTDLITEIIPVGKNKKGKPIFLSTDTGARNEDVVTSQNVSLYPIKYRRLIDYDVQIGKNGIGTKAAARTRLNELATQEYTLNKVDQPKITAQITFADLGSSPEYEEYRKLDSVHLYDTVTIIHNDVLDQPIKVDVVGYIYDCLNRRYQSITLGDIDSLKNQKIVSGDDIAARTVSGSKLSAGTINAASFSSDVPDDLGYNVELHNDSGTTKISGSAGIAVLQEKADAETYREEGKKTRFKSNDTEFGLYRVVSDTDESQDEPIAIGGVDDDGKGFFAANRLHDPTNMANGHIDVRAIPVGEGGGYEMDFMFPDAFGAGFAQGLRIGMRNLPTETENAVYGWIYTPEGRLTTGIVEARKVEQDNGSTDTPFAYHADAIPAAHCFSFTIPANGWVNNQYTLSDIYGLAFGDNVQVFVSPAPASVPVAASSKIICTEYGNSIDDMAYLKFACTTTPTTAIVMNVMIFGGIITNDLDE